LVEYNKQKTAKAPRSFGVCIFFNVFVCSETSSL